MSFCLLFVTLILAYLLVLAARKNKPMNGFRSFFSHYLRERSESVFQLNALCFPGEYNMSAMKAV